MSTNKKNQSEAPFEPLLEKRAVFIRVLKPENVRKIRVVKSVDKREDGSYWSDGRIYASLGKLSDYKEVQTPDGNVDIESSLRQYILKKNHPRQKIEIKSDLGEDELYAVLTDSNLKDVKFAILHDGKLFEECGGHLVNYPLVYTLHSKQDELHRELNDTYNNFVEFLCNWLKEMKLRPEIGTKYGTKYDEFVTDEICGSAYAQVRKPVNTPISETNIKIIAVDPWSKELRI